MDSNASNWSNLSTISAFSNGTGISLHSPRPSDEIYTLCFINTDGQQVISLFEYLQNDMKEKEKQPIICLDLNAVRSRSSSMISEKLTPLINTINTINTI